jgi:hypothetical protein
MVLKSRTCETVVGVGQLLIACTLASSTLIPYAVTT